MLPPSSVTKGRHLLLIIYLFIQLFWVLHSMKLFYSRILQPKRSLCPLRFACRCLWLLKLQNSKLITICVHVKIRVSKCIVVCSFNIGSFVQNLIIITKKPQSALIQVWSSNKCKKLSSHYIVNMIESYLRCVQYSTILLLSSAQFSPTPTHTIWPALDAFPKLQKTFTCKRPDQNDWHACTLASDRTSYITPLTQDKVVSSGTGQLAGLHRKVFWPQRQRQRQRCPAQCVWRWAAGLREAKRQMPFGQPQLLDHFHLPDF